MKWLILLLLLGCESDGYEKRAPINGDCLLEVDAKKFVKYPKLHLNNTMVGIQSGAGIKMLEVSGTGIFIHKKLAKEEEKYVKPVLIFSKCDRRSVIYLDYDRFKIDFGDCKKNIKYLRQL